MDFLVSDIYNFNSFIESKKADCAKSIVMYLNGTIRIEEAMEFVNILLLYNYSEYSKSGVLKEFELFTNHIVINHSKSTSICIISFLIKVLSANGIITECESSIMNKRFIENIQ